MSTLPKILSSNVRADIFCLLFGLNQNDLHLRDLARLSGYAVGSIQGELKNLVTLDLVVKRRDGNRAYFRANTAHPLYPDIRNIVLKTSGMVDILKEAMSEDASVKVAFIYGSIAAGGEKAESDLDLMVIGEIGLRRLSSYLVGVSERLGREVNPHVLEPEAFRSRFKEKDHFLLSVMQAPKLFVVGTENDLNRMAG